MANITFIIGNGLDLSLGLDTRYKDFYKHARENNLHPENSIYKAIHANLDTWADFEIELGKHTHHIAKLPTADHEAASIKFHEELEEVSQDLADYLEAQDQRADGLIGDIRFKRDNFFEELPLGQRDKIHSLIANGTPSLSFINLNYTGTLHKIFPQRNAVITSSGLVIRNAHHLHGTLSENMTLGLSDESQFFSGMSTEEKNDLIKPQLIASMNDGRMEAFEQILESGLVLVLFGTSLGESDKYLWDRVVQWLSSHPARHIIIHAHNRKYTSQTRRTSRGQKQFTAQVQNKLLVHSAFDEAEKAKLKNRIFVIHNTKKLFAKAAE